MRVPWVILAVLFFFAAASRSPWGWLLLMVALGLSLASGRRSVDPMPQPRQRSHSQAPGTGNAASDPRSEPTAAPSPTLDPYRVLEVSRDADSETIRAAYLRLVKLNHPDKVADMAPEFQRLAERRMREINAAYDAILRTR